MADQDAEQRPTFESFWKEDKQKSKDPQIAFVNNPTPKQASTSPKDSSDASPDHGASMDKAQIRRAQVRKAQIQHRQRKAEYIRKLEEDVARYRELITRAERQSQFLSRENELFKEKLRQTSSSQAVSRATAWTYQQAQQLQQQQQQQAQQLQQQQQQQQQSLLTPVTQPSLTPEMDLRSQFEAQHLQDSDPLTVPEPANELFGNIDIGALTVTLSVDETLGTPCFNVSPASSGASNYSATSPAASEADIQQLTPMQLTPMQEQMAVNFILALEHVCWDHFSEEHMTEVDEMLEGALGHTLMASAYCMAQAPESVYSELDNFNTRPENPPTLQWPGQGIDLSTLHGLALSLTNSELEITPVQAWFELAKRYPTNLLLNPNIMASLKREFKSIVRCVYYGAVMDRDAFEAAVSRVLGSMPGISGPIVV